MFTKFDLNDNEWSQKRNTLLNFYIETRLTISKIYDTIHSELVIN